MNLPISSPGAETSFGENSSHMLLRLIFCESVRRGVSMKKMDWFTHSDALPLAEHAPYSALQIESEQAPFVVRQRSLGDFLVFL